MQNRKNKPETEFHHYFPKDNPPIQPHYKVPRWHNIAWIIDWCIVLLASVAIIYSGWWILNKYW